MSDIIDEMLKEKEFKRRVAKNSKDKIEIVLKRYYRNSLGVVYFIRIYVDDMITDTEDYLTREEALHLFEKLKEKYNLVEVD